MIKSGGVVARRALGWAVGTYAVVFTLVTGGFLVEVARTRPTAGAVTVGLVALAVTGAAQLVQWRSLWEGRVRSPWPPLTVQAVAAVVPLVLLPEEWLYVPGLLVASGLLVLHAPLNWWVAGGMAACLAVLVAVSPVDKQLGAGRMVLVLAAGVLAYGLVQFAMALARGEAERRYETKLAVLRERERMARDLHDLLGARLSEASVRGEVALRRIDEGDAGAARTEVESILAAVRSAEQDMRAAVHGRWSLSYMDELRAARGLLKAARVRMRTIGELGRALPPDIDRTLALTLREAVANVLRHSPDCRTVTVRLEAKARSVRLTVANNRPGEPQGGQPPGSGFDSLRERAAALGGRVTAARSDDAYTLTVIISLPDAAHP
ncbi:sensor histidine kinase [Streptomyces nodosus]|uniref:sensor histidine kinase n=1 Tax=Streptomyces nodosus TaxID=40318 RepID=UPI0037FC8E03